MATRRNKSISPKSVAAKRQRAFLSDTFLAVVKLSLTGIGMIGGAYFATSGMLPMGIAIGLVAAFGILGIAATIWGFRTIR